MERPTRYEVICCRTRKVLGTFKSRDRATGFADRKDAAYGAVCCVVKPIWAEAA